MAQKKQIYLEVNPKAPKSEIVKIERINDQDILSVANTTDTIRILLSEEVRNTINGLMQSSVGTGKTLKDIEGADVHILRVKKNTRLGLYFRNMMRPAISVTDEELSVLTSSNDKERDLK